MMVSMTDRVAFEVVVHGRVQGVFFRAECRREALARGVSGWARNEPDGTVRAVFEGPPDAVQQMVAWAHQGPTHASVARVDVSECRPSGAAGFGVG
jgi:acylphosphatase